jgi:hypothetical protein
MQRRIPVAVSVLLGVVAFGWTPSGAEEKLQKLTGAQVRARFAGMELTDQVHGRELYARNGAWTSTSMGRKSVGKWRIERDQLCVEIEKAPPAKCYEVWGSGQNVELRREGMLPLQGILQKPSQQN